MAEGNYEFLATGRNNTELSLDAFQDGTDVNGSPLVRLIARQELAFRNLVSDIKTAVEGTIDVAVVSGGGGGGDSFSLIDSTAVTVDTTATTIIDIDCKGKDSLGCVISNAGATAFDDFQVLVRWHPDQGFYNPITFSSADFEANVGRQSGNTLVPVQASSGIGNATASPNPRALAGGASGWLEMRVSAYESVRLTAKVASGTTTARIRGNVQ